MSNYIDIEMVNKFLDVYDDTVHVFRGGLIGCDWGLGEVEKFKNKMVFSGNMAMALNHGLAALDGDDWLFFATNPEFKEYYDKLNPDTDSHS